MPLAQVPSEVKAFWSRTAEAISSPLCLSPLNHLLFEMRKGNASRHARAAMSAYFELGTGSLDGLDGVPMTRAE